MSKTTGFDIVFCVFGCVTIERYKNEIIKIEETWGLKARNMNYKVLFFLGEEKSDLIGQDYIYLDGVQNDYLSASYKQNLGLKYIYENYECNFIYICGTDTYISIDNLVKYLARLDPEENISIGDGTTRRIEDRDSFYLSGGPGFAISYIALQKVYPFLENMVQTWASVPKQHGWDLSAACDVCLCYYLNKTGNHKFIKEDELFFNWNYKSLKRNIIGCHEMTLQDFDDYTEIINNS
jgi:hypothetical protein